jgi:hypothetical protein
LVVASLVTTSSAAACPFPSLAAAYPFTATKGIANTTAVANIEAVDIG